MWWNVRGIGSAFVIWAAAASGAEARLWDARFSVPDEEVRAAVHIPTGCKAKISVRGNALVTAMITDPDCLPKGVSARHVPASMTDFGKFEVLR